MDYKQTFIVAPLWISEHKLCYHCPFCGKKHRHNNDGDFSNRTENRMTHCSGESTFYFVDIKISGDTPRLIERKVNGTLNNPHYALLIP